MTMMAVLHFYRVYILSSAILSACGSLDEHSFHTIMFEHLVSSWRNCLESIRMDGLVGGVSPGKSSIPNVLCASCGSGRQ